MRPNSVQQTTVTSSVRPRRFRSLSSPAIGLSTRAHDRVWSVLQLGVRIPLAVVAEIDQREAHAALDQPAGGQQPAAVDGRGLLVDAVEPLRLGRLAGQVERLGHRRLHAEGQFVRLDPGPELVVVGILDGRQPVQLADELELLRLLLGRDVLEPRAERQRIVRVERQLDAGVLRARGNRRRSSP